MKKIGNKESLLAAKQFKMFPHVKMRVISDIHENILIQKNIRRNFINTKILEEKKIPRQQLETGFTVDLQHCK